MACKLYIKKRFFLNLCGGRWRKETGGGKTRSHRSDWRMVQQQERLRRIRICGIDLREVQNRDRPRLGDSLWLHSWLHSSCPDTTRDCICVLVSICKTTTLVQGPTSTLLTTGLLECFCCIHSSYFSICLHQSHGDLFILEVWSWHSPVLSSLMMSLGS